MQVARRGGARRPVLKGGCVRGPHGSLSSPVAPGVAVAGPSRRGNSRHETSRSDIPRPSRPWRRPCSSAIARVRGHPVAARHPGQRLGHDVLHAGPASGRALQHSIGCRVIALPGDTQPLDNECLSDTGVEVHTENYAHDRVSEAAPLGSSVGILQLCSQGQSGVAHIDFARSSRAPKNPDSCTGLHFVGYARDGLSWESFPDEASSPSVGVTDLTSRRPEERLHQLHDQQLEPDRRVAPTAPSSCGRPRPGRARAPTWDGFVGGDSTACIPAMFKDGDPTNGEHVIPENNDDPIFNTPGRRPEPAEERDLLLLVGPVQRAPRRHELPRKDRGHRAHEDHDRQRHVPVRPVPVQRLLRSRRCCGTASQAPSWVTNYVGEKGWICNQDTSKHATDPLTGQNYGNGDHGRHRRSRLRAAEEGQHRWRRQRQGQLPPVHHLS